MVRIVSWRTSAGWFERRAHIQANWVLDAAMLSVLGFGICLAGTLKCKLVKARLLRSRRKDLVEVVDSSTDRAFQCVTVNSGRL